MLTLMQKRAVSLMIPALIFLLGLGLGPQAYAQTEPLKDRTQLLKPVPETFVKTKNHKRVIRADYDLLKKDFPLLIGKSKTEIDEWLIRQVGDYIAIPQAQSTITNSPIIYDLAETKIVDRPQDYGRGSVMPVEGGLIDVKGSGALKPSQEESRNGLLAGSDALREYMYEHVVREIMAQESPDIKTVGSYAVIDVGFNIRWPDGKESPATYLLRQAKPRVDRPYSLLNSEQSVRVEKILRKYGITSAGAHRHLPFRLLNVQGSQGRNPSQINLVDFGAYLTIPDIDINKGEAYAIEEWLAKGETKNTAEMRLLMNPEKNPGDVVSIHKHRLSWNLWGYSELNIADPAYDNPAVWSHRTLDHIRLGWAPASSVDDLYKTMVENSVEPWRLKENFCKTIFRTLMRAH